jgi:hypothetical protein
VIFDRFYAVILGEELLPQRPQRARRKIKRISVFFVRSVINLYFQDFRRMSLSAGFSQDSLTQSRKDAKFQIFFFATSRLCVKFLPLYLVLLKSYFIKIPVIQSMSIPVSTPLKM